MPDPGNTDFPKGKSRFPTGGNLPRPVPGLSGSNPEVKQKTFAFYLISLLDACFTAFFFAFYEAASAVRMRILTSEANKVKTKKWWA